MSDKITSNPLNRVSGFTLDNLRRRWRAFQIGLGFSVWGLGLAALLIGTGGFSALGQSTNSSLRPDYSTFKIVNDRNIFNPHRRGRSSRAPETQSTSKADSFALVGTMSYEKGIFAFFDGSKSEFRKVVKPAETIAGYTVTDIAPNSVKLVSGTNQIELNIGSQMRREEEDDWRLSARKESSASTRTVGTANRRVPERRTTPPGTPAETVTTESPASDATVQADIADVPSEGTSTNASSSETDDPVLRRLMQRREQEINR
jgi:hypothetical protein